MSPLDVAILLAADGTPWGVIVPAGILVLLALLAIGAYNGLVKVRNHVDESWSDVETEMKRRYELIPNLVETVKGYATHERETLDRVVSARNAAAAPHTSPEALARDDNVLSGALRQLFAVAEAYPDLKANANFLELQRELTNTEDRIQRSRRFYNGNVRDLNTRIESFPTNVIAGMFSFEKREFFELEEPEARKAPKVSF